MLEQTGEQAFEIVNDGAAADCLIICDHAASHVPAHLDSLGLPAPRFSEHIAVDIGAAEVSRELARLLDCPAVLCGTSRLVVDCNREPYTFAWIPPESDGVLVPGNQNISQDEMDFRMQLYFEPYHREIERRLEASAAAGTVPLLISIHSFTPRLMDGADRPWHVAILSCDDRRVADPLLGNLRRQTDYLIGDNEPYSGTSPLGYSLKAYNMERGLPFAMFEIRQDLLADPNGARHWAEVVAEAMRPIRADESLRTIRRS